MYLTQVYIQKGGFKSDMIMLGGNDTQLLNELEVNDRDTKLTFIYNYIKKFSFD